MKFVVKLLLAGAVLFFGYRFVVEGETPVDVFVTSDAELAADKRKLIDRVHDGMAEAEDVAVETASTADKLPQGVLEAAAEDVSDMTEAVEAARQAAIDASDLAMQAADAGAFDASSDALEAARRAAEAALTAAARAEERGADVAREVIDVGGDEASTTLSDAVTQAQDAGRLAQEAIEYVDMAREAVAEAGVVPLQEVERTELVAD